MSLPRPDQESVSLSYCFDRFDNHSNILFPDNQATKLMALYYTQFLVELT